MKLELHSNEVVIRAADTNHYINDSKVSGKLILTNQRLYFTRTNGGGESLKIEIEPSLISEVILFKNKALFSTGLCLLTKNGQELKFEVKDRNSWASGIARML